MTKRGRFHHGNLPCKLKTNMQGNPTASKHLKRERTPLTLVGNGENQREKDYSGAGTRNPNWNSSPSSLVRHDRTVNALKMVKTVVWGFNDQGRCMKAGRAMVHSSSLSNLAHGLAKMKRKKESGMYMWLI